VGGADRIEIVLGDITREDVDAVVNAANARLAHGGGVARAISNGAGPELQRACDELVDEYGPLSTGKAVATDAFRLPCRKVIHAVGPIYGRHGGREAELLAAAHRSAVSLAAELGLTSIAFPAISCGIYSYPLDEAAPIAISSTIEALSTAPDIARVRFCFIAEPERSAFERALVNAAGARRGSHRRRP
jgi:O-acetyl-ADP-ribose deacetylase (regulator of RNase III)